MDNLEQKLTALASEIGVSKSIDILSAMRASILATMQGGFKSDPLPPTPSKWPTIVMASSSRLVSIAVVPPPLAKNSAIDTSIWHSSREYMP